MLSDAKTAMAASLDKREDRDSTEYEYGGWLGGAFPGCYGRIGSILTHRQIAHKVEAV
jgi:hypothetical protein